MEEKTSLAHDIEIAGEKVQLDTNVKQVLANKEVLSRIMKGTMTEFVTYPLDVIMKCIEGEPEISEESVHQAEKITGMQTEDNVPGEGVVTYDIKFYAITPDGNRMKLIIDVEAQEKFNPGYDLTTRGIYYCSRMISAQKHREFERSDYDKIKKVYSIWICMNAPEEAQNTITEYRMGSHDIAGHFECKARYDLMSVVMIRLGNSIAKYRGTLLGFLDTLLLMRGDEQKEKDLEEIYGLKMTRKMSEEVRDMCNVSEYFIERGLQEGIQQGIKAFIRDYTEENFSKERILEKLQKNFELTEEQAKDYYEKYSKEVVQIL